MDTDRENTKEAKGRVVVTKRGGVKHPVPVGVNNFDFSQGESHYFDNSTTDAAITEGEGILQMHNRE